MISALFLAGALAASPCAPGKLVIVGGALASDNRAARAPLIESAGADGRIAIVPVASQAPSASAAAFAADLARDGFSTDRVDVVRLAVEDDPETSDVDESAWAGAAWDPREIAKIDRAHAIWFVGGDQSRVTGALRDPRGSETPMLAAIRERNRCGAALGGTSAGAAIMSRVMITGGDSLSALTRGLGRAAPEGEALGVAAGLGFLASGVVDQHFSERARLGRLARALSQEPPGPRRVGFGIDENTALIVDQAAQTAEVAGAGHVVIVDAREARLSEAGPIRGLVVSWLSAGDRVRLDTVSITPAEGKAAVAIPNGRTTKRAQEGVATPSTRLVESLGEAFGRGEGARAVERVSFAPDGAGGALRFVREEGSTMAFEGDDATTLLRVRVDLTPVRVRVEGRP